MAALQCALNLSGLRLDVFDHLANALKKKKGRSGMG
jgi:hypothetical protein